MLAIEQTGFAGIPRPDAMADCGMINIPFGNHANENVTERTNLGYVNVWDKFNGSLVPAEWSAGKQSFDGPYQFCTFAPYGYDNSYLDASLSYEVFKMSSVYMGE